MQCVELAHIQQAQIVFHIPLDVGFGTDIKVEVDDAELFGPMTHVVEEPWRQQMDAGKSIPMALPWL